MDIGVEGLSFDYGKSNVLDDITLNIEGPGLVSIIGPNGVGKSTLLRCLNKLNKPARGRVLIDGEDIENYSFKELARIMTYVPTNSSDLFSMNVIDTVLMGRSPFQRGSKVSDLDFEIANRSIRIMDMEDYALRNFNELSAGQHQKVTISRGLAQTPKILIMDEPTANLDVCHQMQTMEVLKYLSKAYDMLVVMVSHDLNIAAKYSDKLILMAPPGIIHSVGSPVEVLTEDNIESVYRIKCRILMENGAPHIISQYPLSDAMAAIRDSRTEH